MARKKKEVTTEPVATPTKKLEGKLPTMAVPSVTEASSLVKREELPKDVIQISREEFLKYKRGGRKVYAVMGDTKTYYLL